MQVEGGALGGLMADLTGSLEHMFSNEPEVAPAQTDNQSDKNTSKSGNISINFGGTPTAPGQIPSTIPAPHMGDANVAQIQQDLTDMPLNYPRGQETLYPDKGGLKEGQETLKKEIKRGEQVGIIGIAIAFMLFLTQK
jgi:hypothetical protein